MLLRLLRLGAEEEAPAGGLELRVEPGDAVDLAVSHHVALPGKHLAGGAGGLVLEGLGDAVAARRRGQG